MKKVKPTTVTTTPTPFQDLALVCRKCSKKLDGGFGKAGDEPLGRAMKQMLRATGRRQSVRVIETKCLGLCPKGAVTMLWGSRPGEMLAVPGGTDLAVLVAVPAANAGY